MIPYKRHCSQSIEAVITGEKVLSVVADESTINRWKQWLRASAGYFLGRLISIAFYQEDGSSSFHPLSISPIPASFVASFFL